MPYNNDEFLFICRQHNDHILVATKSEVDNEVQRATDNNYDIDFTVIAKVPANVKVDFSPSLITWYDDKEKEKSFIDKVIMTIINYIY